MQLNAGMAERLISDLGIEDMPLMQVRPIPTRVSTDWYSQYKVICREFMMSLTDSIGRALPENMSIRFRIPLVWGGKLTIDNLFMCKTFPHSHNMDRFIISQSGNGVIWLPNPAKKVYLPVSTFGGGDGGNGTEDRLTETIAAQIAADRDM